MVFKKSKYVDHCYNPDFHPDDLIERMDKGELNVQVAAAWNISQPTFYRWRKEHPELEDAYQKGLTKYEAQFIKNVFQPMIEGKLQGRHAFNSAIAIANNKLGWSRGSDGNTTNNTQINITVNNNKTNEELIEQFNKDLQYLVDMNVIDAEVVPEKNLIEVTDASKSNEQNKE